MKKKDIGDRKKYIDIAKGFSILSIIAGHMNVLFVDRFVYTYHVPIFFIISGFFLKKKTGEIKKRSRRLLIPYIFTVLAILIADELKNIIKIFMKKESTLSILSSARHWLIAGVYGSGSKTHFLKWELPSIGAIWFLPAILWSCVLLYIIINKYSSIKLQSIIIIVCFIIAIFSAEWEWMPFSVQAGMAGLLFLYVGYLSYNHLKIDVSENLKILFLSSIIWGIDLWCSYTNDCMSLVRCYFPNCIINVIGAVAATYVILVIAKLVEKTNYLAKFLEIFGKYSNVVLCFHLFELQIFPWNLVYEIGVVHTKLVIIILKILWAYIGIIMTRKIKFLQKVLM